MKYSERVQYKKKKGPRRSYASNKVVISFLAPALIIFLIFVVYPLIKTFRLSFFKWRGITKGAEEFVGIENFINLFHDKIF